MELSVIVCTYNRCRSLRACIESIAGQVGVETLAWELVVVDNGSSDETSAVVSELAASSSIRLRYVHEPARGLCRARNRGIAATDSRFVAFTDDDVVADRGWLAAMHGVLRDERCDVAGGRIWIRTPDPLPPWIGGELVGCLGFLDLGPTSLPMDGTTTYPFGANMAFHRRAFGRAGTFDERIGRSGTGKHWWELMKGEEQALVRQVLATGGRALYCPDAIVWHCVEPHQVKRKFFRQLHFSAGFQCVALAPRCREYSASRSTVELCKAIGRYVEARARSGPEQAFRKELAAFWVAGMLAAAFVPTPLPRARGSRRGRPCSSSTPLRSPP